jgi:hypothetical protein
MLNAGHLASHSGGLPAPHGEHLQLVGMRFSLLPLDQVTNFRRLLHCT